MMKRHARYRNCMRMARRHWIAVTAAVALLLSSIAAPTTGLDMGAAHAVAGGGAHEHVANGTDPMVGPCCDDCDDAEPKSCGDTALCMITCGKLPMQPMAAAVFLPSKRVATVVHEPDIGRADILSSPLRRPPKAV